MDKIYTAKEVAEYLKLDTRRIYEEIATEKLRAIKIGRIYRITETALKEYLSLN